MQHADVTLKQCLPAATHPASSTVNISDNTSVTENVYSSCTSVPCHEGRCDHGGKVPLVPKLGTEQTKLSVCTWQLARQLPHKTERMKNIMYSRNNFHVFFKVKTVVHS
jgi:hypothetical protein